MVLLLLAHYYLLKGSPSIGKIKKNLMKSDMMILVDAENKWL
jgi:hypothetical protein